MFRHYKDIEKFQIDNRYLWIYCDISWYYMPRVSVPHPHIAGPPASFVCVSFKVTHVLALLPSIGGTQPGELLNSHLHAMNSVLGCQKNPISCITGNFVHIFFHRSWPQLWSSLLWKYPVSTLNSFITSRTTMPTQMHLIRSKISLRNWMCKVTTMNGQLWSTQLPLKISTWRPRDLLSLD